MSDRVEARGTMGLPRHGLGWLALLAAAGGASAQQFVEVPDLLPGPAVWSEAVAALDANGDGRLDLIFANAQGYARPGDYRAPSPDPLAPTLLLNTPGEDGELGFVDASERYLPADLRMHAKAVTVVDVDLDGHRDLVFAVAFGGTQVLLRQDPESGRYVREAGRLPEVAMNAFHVSWGDLDDDGDPDLVFTDAGERSFGLPGGVPRLFLNDGGGRFHEASEQLYAKPKVGPQNAKIVDLDRDQDLDIVLDGKSMTTQVYLNDGRGRFTLDVESVPPPAWSDELWLEADAADRAQGGTGEFMGTYEIEWGDLDGDGDLDAVYMNYAARDRLPFGNAALENRLADSGLLTLVPHAKAMDGPNFHDENDVLLLDVDDDGDLDVLFAVLTFFPGPEKLFRNAGAFGEGFLEAVEGAVASPHDATLDLLAADFDGDGRYDLVSAQGEIPGTDFRNRFYRNTGPADSTPPRLLSRGALPASIPLADLRAGSVILRAAFQDAVVDDGVSWVTAALGWKVGEDEGVLSMAHVGGAMHRGALTLDLEAHLGAELKVTLTASDPAGNRYEGEPETILISGSRAYGVSSGLELEGPERAAAGLGFEVAVAGGSPGGAGTLVVGYAAAEVDLEGGKGWVEVLGARRLPFTFDDEGTARVSVPGEEKERAGTRLFLQATGSEPDGAPALSGGVELVLDEAP